ncbi:NEDD4-binding protein 2 isoform X1 [Pseudophryne corroboree]|uniref:NEDD4-binding protein 2 isoform X1 n=1 Tax=Pseudophryne corroboree TaxID=495146 RepID=UPI003081C197
MPRKRKSLSASPQRKTSNAGSILAPSSSAALPLPSAMSNKKEEMLCSMCEMFPNLDPALVEMVLSEYKEVEVVMDCLLELSTDTKGETQLESTGFHKIASFLDDFQANSESSENVDPASDQIEEPQDDLFMDGTLCNDLDTLLDETLDRYGLSSAENIFNTELCEHSVPTVSTDMMMPERFQNTPFQTDEMEVTVHSQTDLEREDYQDDLYLDASPPECNGDTVPTSPSDAPKATEKSKPEVDFSKTPQMIFKFEGSKKPVNKQSTGLLFTPPLSSVSSQSHTKWNPMASSFYPTSNPQSLFFTPVAAIPVPWMAGARVPFRGISYSPQVPPLYNWNFNHILQTSCSAQNVKPVSQYEPGPPIGPQISKKATKIVGNVLILLRGAPGSGKSTLARVLLEQNPAGVILSTDDYFKQNGRYKYDVTCLEEAHEWNHKRARDAFEKTVSPIIIDNTNLQGWEMKPYVSMAMKHKYKVTFREPDTWWKYKPKELERRNAHGVKKEKIKKMLEHFERVTVNSILNLSHPKTSERAEICQIIKPGEKNRPDSLLPPTSKEEETCFSETSVTHPENTSALEMSKEGPEISLFKQPVIENLRHADDKNENCVDLVQYAEALNICDEESNHIDCSVDSDGLEAATADTHVSCTNSDLVQFSERPELQSFVGDWPVEHTMSQRAPRSKKKTKIKREMHDPPAQQASEEEQTTDYSMAQIDIKPVEHDPSKESSILKLKNDVDSTSCLHEEEKVIDLALFPSTDEEMEAQGKLQSDAADVNEPSLVAQVTEIVAKNEDVLSVEEDVKMKSSPTKRNGWHCKLALTFTNTCSSSLKDNETQHICESLGAIEQASVGLCRSSQTEPQDFALAWRIERKNLDIVDPIKVITGKSSRFKSKSLETNLNAQEHIPYRVMHHKSTAVEEDDIIRLGDEDSLNILCKLFRSLSFEVLKDLFERCNKDIVWTTNLLLDSGEKIYKDEECQSENDFTSEREQCKHLVSCCQSKDNVQSTESLLIHDSSLLNYDILKMDDCNFKDSSLKACENITFVNEMPLVVAEEFKNCNVLSSNEVNITPDYQNKVSTESNSLNLHKEMVTDLIGDHKPWDPDLEKGQLGAPDNSTEELYVPSPDMFQKTCILHQEDPLVDKDVEQTVDIVAEEDKMKNNNSRSRSKESLHFDYLELSLPPEFAFQLTELFGPVGIDPGSLTIEDCVVPVNLQLAKSIHKMWKESIMERHNQESLSYQLLFEDSSPNDSAILDDVLQAQETGLLGEQFDVCQGDADLFPFMDQWNTRTKKVSLRQIMSEELALQVHEDLKKSVPRKNCAVKMKENQLLELFPHVEQNLLMDVFKENNYSLEETEQFLSYLLEADPVQNVVAQGMKQAVPSVADKTKEKRVKVETDILSEQYFQDLEYPDYDDFRAEAFLYRQKQQESYRKAAEAHNRGMKQVAAYYAQQGYLYGQKMKEENRRAAVQIYERANEYLLPENILDLHGLHVDEAMKHFRKVLQDKTEEIKQNGGKTYLLVITGRGNHSQGGVPRIKPAIIDYLTNHDYRTYLDSCTPIPTASLSCLEAELAEDGGCVFRQDKFLIRNLAHQ